jgi:hypothetical protein
MKTIFIHVGLVVGAIFVALMGLEFVLALSGAYQELVEQDLKSSPAIWERPKSKVEFHRHPDLKIPIRINYDRDGVRNHDQVSTSEKRMIVGIFGDSFTENRRVDDRFTFTRLLDEISGDAAKFVNFGVDAYGVEQSYLRYKKYADLELSTVVYVLCENDLRNLYENNLIRLGTEGQVIFNKPQINRFFRFLGKRRLTYLVLTGYYQMRAHINNLSTDARYFSDPLYRNAEKFSVSRKRYKKRLHDAYSNSITEDFVSPSPTAETLALAETFRAVLRQWRDEVVAAGREFHIIVLPRDSDDKVARKLLGTTYQNVFYLSEFLADYQRYRFKYDVHWNEWGNIKAAQAIISYPGFERFFKNQESRAADVFETAKEAAQSYYDANTRP